MEDYNDPIKLSGITHYDEIHIAPSTFSIQRAGVEAYLTDEEGFEPYVSPQNAKANSNIEKADVENENSEESSEEDTKSVNDNTPSSAYTLHQGNVIETYYYTDLFKLDFESDYKEMTSSATFERSDVNLKQFYKGVRVKLLTEWEEPDTLLKWEDLTEAEIGFITEQTFKEDCVEVKIDGMEALLNQVLSFEFKSMPRAEIISEILKSAGLNPIINVEGLDNDVINFVNERKTNTATASSDNKPIGKSTPQIAKLAQQLCQGKTTDLGKAQAIHSFIAKVEYPPNNYPNHKRCPVEVVRRMECNCCDRARLGHEMANAVGLHNRGVHGSGAQGEGHVWIQYKINGKWVDSDPSPSRPKLGQVYGPPHYGGWTFEEC